MLNMSKVDNMAALRASLSMLIQESITCDSQKDLEELTALFKTP